MGGLKSINTCGVEPRSLERKTVLDQGDFIHLHSAREDRQKPTGSGGGLQKGGRVNKGRVKIDFEHVHCL